MATVWVPKGSHHNFKAAEKFGRVAFVFADQQETLPVAMDLPKPVSVSPFHVDRLQAVVEALLPHVKADDYLCLSGPAIMVMLIFHAWFKAFGVCHVLIYHAKDDEYVLRTVRA